MKRLFIIQNNSETVKLEHLVLASFNLVHFLNESEESDKISDYVKTSDRLNSKIDKIASKIKFDKINWNVKAGENIYPLFKEYIKTVLDKHKLSFSDGRCYGYLEDVVLNIL